MFIDEAIKDEVTYANLIEMLKPDCKKIINETYGFLIHHISSDMNVLLCDCKDGYEEKFLEEIKKSNTNYIEVFNEKLVELLTKNNFKPESPCYQLVYRGEKIDSSELIKLKKEDLDFVKNTYDEGTSKDYVQHVFDENNLYGYYKNNELMGYVGYHSKSNLGLLYVKPEHRRAGLGSKILKMAFSKCEDFGHPYPYSHIFLTNEISLKLHKKLGCEYGKKKVIWLFKTKK